MWEFRLWPKININWMDTNGIMNECASAVLERQNKVKVREIRNKNSYTILFKKIYF